MKKVLIIIAVLLMVMGVAEVTLVPPYYESGERREGAITGESCQLKSGETITQALELPESTLIESACVMLKKVTPDEEGSELSGTVLLELLDEKGKIVAKSSINIGEEQSHMPKMYTVKPDRPIKGNGAAMRITPTSDKGSFTLLIPYSSSNIISLTYTKASSSRRVVPACFLFLLSLAFAAAALSSFNSQPPKKPDSHNLHKNIYQQPRKPYGA